MRAQLLEKQASIEENPLREADLPVPEPRRGEVLLKQSKLKASAVLRVNP